MSTKKTGKRTDYSDYLVGLCKKRMNNTSSRHNNIIIFVLIALFIITWSIFLHYYPPKLIVATLGINNTYLAIFMLSLIGGVSTFTSTTFYTVLITIALSEVNPVWLGLIASLGLTLGDLLFYYMGRKGKQCVPGKYEAKIIKLTSKMEQINDKLIVLIIFLYSLTPLPSDILAIGLAFGGFSVKKLIPPLFVGNFVLIVLLVEFSRLGYGIL